MSVYINNAARRLCLWLVECWLWKKKFTPTVAPFVPRDSLTLRGFVDQSPRVRSCHAVFVFSAFHTPVMKSWISPVRDYCITSCPQINTQCVHSFTTILPSCSLLTWRCHSRCFSACSPTGSRGLDDASLLPLPDHSGFSRLSPGEGVWRVTCFDYVAQKNCFIVDLMCSALFIWSSQHTN